MCAYYGSDDFLDYPATEKNRDLKDETKAINAELATWKLKYNKLMKAEEEAKEKKKQHGNW